MPVPIATQERGSSAIVTGNPVSLDINLYASEHSINQIKQRFGYVFEKLLPEANGF